ncbi:MAG: VTC domain-containing protein [Bianqueaceae bacterium]
MYPAVFLSYEREAFYSRDGSDFRITFDDHILCRQEDLSLRSEVYGTPLLPEDMALMEIKCSGGIPLWMTHVLTENQIYKTSFSKYGTAYQNIIFPN